ncbi:DUF3068 domain-containing protein [Actinophytocola sp.]|uniref:DUF3068 domain-containing protein n=1 Tax=Actinophytocola sp. TaxID=1872138 RepID=UPI003D6C5086
MRRIVSFILLGLGVFAVALGLLLRFYAYPQLAKIPLDNESTSVAEGDGVTALVIRTVNGAPSPEIRRNLSLTSTTYVTGDLTQPEVEEGGDVAVYVEATKTTDDATGIVVDASVRALCIDRHTNEAVAPCEGQYIEAEQGQRVAADRSTIQQPGLSFKFPFGTEQRDYPFYDMSVRKPVNARFDGEETIQGVNTYRFVMDVPPTKIGDEEVPGSLIGRSDQPSVDTELYYQVKRTVWVEPETGIIVVGQEEGRQELLAQGQDPGEGTTVYEGLMRFNEATINDNVNKAEDNVSKLSLLTSWPVAMWVGGGILIVVGLGMLLAGNQRGGRYGTGPPLRRQPAGAAR